MSSGSHSRPVVDRMRSHLCRWVVLTAPWVQLDLVDFGTADLLDPVQVLMCLMFSWGRVVMKKIVGGCCRSTNCQWGCHWPLQQVMTSHVASLYCAAKAEEPNVIFCCASPSLSRPILVSPPGSASRLVRRDLRPSSLVSVHF